MNSLAKLKEQARNHELREEWRQAASAYLEVLHQAEDGEVGELALYNRVGDLHLRLGQAEEAVRYYEQAADRYAEAGLFNNAIALCNKALRYAPTRMNLLRKLGRFSAAQGFLTDARRWFLEYGERAIRAGDADNAVSALEEYSRMADDAEAREIIAHKLMGAGRREQALTQYQRAHAMWVMQGRGEAAAALEAVIRERFPEIEDLTGHQPVPAAEEPGAERAPGTVRPAPPPVPDTGESPDLAPPVGLPGFDDRPAAGNDTDDATLQGFEQTSLASDAPGAPADQASRPEGLETTQVATAPLPEAATTPAPGHADDMDWVRGRPARPAPPAPAPAPVHEEFVDLSALLGLGETGETETRWFIEESEPTGDEDRDFAELLTQFKEKLLAHIAHDDAGAHYDLGIAFKEMGLLDEAIGQFQVALRGQGDRLKILEELGHCFLLKSHHTVAIKVLKRALELETNDELERIGVYYYLGRAYEEQGDPVQAKDAYERVVGLDIGFQDVTDRMARL